MGWAFDTVLHAGGDGVNILLKDFTDEHDGYFDACARLRDISKTALLKRLLDVIGRDQLVLSILDDDSKPEPKKKGEHGYRPKTSVGGSQ